MAEPNEVQALEKISTEVGESQIKITLSSQCIKAQAFLADKLWKQIERQKEICSFISNNNFKLQTEIKHAELEIKSLIIAQETIKSGNIELKKEFLLAKEKKSEISERIDKGEKKYEALWLECKERYEGIPFVQKLLQATSKTNTLQVDVIALEKKSQLLLKELEEKKKILSNLDRNSVIELANYFIVYLPNTVKAIQEKTAMINSLSKEIDEIVKKKETVVSQHINTIPPTQNVKDKSENEKMMEDSWLNISSNIERNIITMPRLHIINSDFDALNAKLDKIKIMKVDFLNNTTAKRTNPDENILDSNNKKIKDDELSLYFNNGSTEKDTKVDTYSRKKLINILEDVKIDRNDAYNLMSKVNFENLKGVNTIGEKNTINKDNIPESEKENENIEEIDLTKSNATNNSAILIPPTQFLDQEKCFSNSQQHVEVIVHMTMTEPSSEKLSQSLKNSQESSGKKKVSFDVPSPAQEIINITNNEEFGQKKYDNGVGNETIDSQMDISLVSDESYSNIKDMILKKHNLDLSPQFTYAKSKMMQLNTEEKVIKSKFFQTEKLNVVEVEEINKEQVTDTSKEPESQAKTGSENHNEEPMEIGLVSMSSPKPSQSVKADRVVTGLLFNHGTQGIPDSLNVSISTTGFDEGDTDFPHCIDSSLLLSPKADMPMPMNEDNIEVTSQEVPNFLSGLRKTGLSFFGQSESTDPKPGTSGQNQGNQFNFNFGGGEQKTRGGLFSMFR